MKLFLSYCFDRMKLWIQLDYLRHIVIEIVIKMNLLYSSNENLMLGENCFLLPIVWNFFFEGLEEWTKKSKERFITVVSNNNGSIRTSKKIISRKQ